MKKLKTKLKEIYLSGKSYLKDELVDKFASFKKVKIYPQGIGALRILPKDYLKSQNQFV